METGKMETGGRGKLQFRIDLALTVLFIATIFFFLLATCLLGTGLWGHLTYMAYISEYLDDPNDYTAWDLMEASIRSVDGFIASSLYGTSELGKVNAGFQYALGKRLVSTGGTQMIRLNTGHLYDLQSEMSMEPAKQEILSIRNAVPEGTPFIFAYEHPTIYDEEAQMPAGYGFLDFSTRQADEVVGALRARGVDVLDSREVLGASGLALEDFLMYTDQHWSTRAALTMAQAIARRAEEVTGIDLPDERLDIGQFDTEVLQKRFLGKYGQRVGTLMIDPDDIVLYTPKYPTSLRVRSSSRGNPDEREGAFQDVLLRGDVLPPEPGKSWNIRAYMDYGLTEDYDIITNDDAPDCTILLLKDSFGAPVGRFLSLVANKVYSVDLRSYHTGPLAEWIEESDPDIVVAAYSMQMLRNENYEFQ